MRAKGVLIGIAALVGVLALVFILTWVGLGGRYFFAEPSGRVEQEVQVQSAEFRIYSYEHFYELCASIRGHEHALDSQRAQLEATTSEPEQQRIRANLAGVEATRGRAIERYNAEARQEETTGQFRAANLPERIPAEPYDGERKTECE